MSAVPGPVPETYQKTVDGTLQRTRTPRRAAVKPAKSSLAVSSHCVGVPRSRQSACSPTRYDTRTSGVGHTSRGGSTRRITAPVCLAPRQSRNWARSSVREVLGEPDGAGAVAVDGDADVGEGAAQDVEAVAVVGRLLVEHGLGEADRHLGDGR